VLYRLYKRGKAGIFFQHTRCSMIQKRTLIIGAVIFGVYAIGVYVYFSTRPTSRYDCPIMMPDAAPIVLDDPADPLHHFTTINDASCLNQTRVYDIVAVKTVDDIRRALKVAQEKNIPVSIAGVRHCMGGQAFYNDAIVLDMTHFNRVVSLDETHKILTVESGATWHQIQEYLHPKNFAVKAMQSTDIFSVGGSLSVNAHGMDHMVGSVASTVRSFTMMFADGTIQKITQAEQPKLFNAVIGGYGLFGVILEVALDITDNVMYEFETTLLKCSEFPAFFQDIMKDNTYELMYAHLSTSPVTFLRDMIVYGYKKVPYTEPFPPLKKINLVSFRRFLINLSKRRSYAQVVKWVAEKYIDPAIYKYSGENLTSRNNIMHDSVEYLENVLINETDLLHEYFVPRNQLVPFIDQMRTVLKKSGIPVLNVSIRVVNKESIMLNYAPKDMFAVVLYLNQKVNKQALEKMEQLTRDLIDVTLGHNGTFFLPYQLCFTSAQLHKAYPNIDALFALKKEYDPSLRFMNSLYAKYAPK
jgi:FAD/FMN-containing dehydrogenase